MIRTYFCFLYRTSRTLQAKIYKESGIVLQLFHSNEFQHSPQSLSKPEQQLSYYLSRQHKVG